MTVLITNVRQPLRSSTFCGKDLGITIEEKLILVEVFIFLDYRSLDD